MVLVLVGVEDVGVLLVEEAGDAGYEAFLVGAVDEEDCCVGRSRRDMSRVPDYQASTSDYPDDGMLQTGQAQASLAAQGYYRIDSHSSARRDECRHERDESEQQDYSCKSQLDRADLC